MRSPAIIMPGCQKTFSRSGFSLLEVLVALALFAILSAVVAQTSANLIQSRLALSSTRDCEGAITRWAINTILKIETREAMESGGILSLPNGNSIHWDAGVTAVEMIDVFTLDLTLEYRNRPTSKESTRTLSTTIHRPGWMTPQEREAVMRERQDKWETLSRERNLSPQ